MDQQQADELLNKYLHGTAGEAERAIVDRWYEAEAGGRKLPEGLQFEHLGPEIWEGTLQKAGITRRPVKRMLYRRAAAAAILLLLAAGGMLYIQRSHTPAPPAQASRQAAPILPGSNKAVLTLGNGDVISLTDAANGELATQGDTRITKTDNGQLRYDPAGDAAGAGRLNTISTPRGGQYRVDLPDGTRAWLNAASALTFPPAFNGLAERRVQLTGEAYFEVAKNAARPFIVESNGQTITVLGTSFNVNVYSDEPDMKTTLLEGAVKVNGSLLRPGQQAVLKNGAVTIRQVDADTETAWRKGEFMFNGQDFKTVMRMISRWYDVDVVYEYEPAAIRIGGEVSRNRSIREVLKMLEVTGGMKFRIEGRTVTITR